jgi:hypothetical protein
VELALFTTPPGLIDGRIGPTVNILASDVPPPGGGLVTARVSVPAVARSGALSRTVIWLLLRNVAGWGTPLTVTEEEEVSPVPLTVTVSEPEPALTDGGDKLVMTGSGFIDGAVIAVVVVATWIDQEPALSPNIVSF